MGVSQSRLGWKAGTAVLDVAVVGFGSHAKAAIDLFFMRQARSYRLVAVADAQVLILDMEHPEALAALEQYQHTRAIVAVTATDHSFGDLVTLPKPLASKALGIAIRQAVQRQEQACVAAITGVASGVEVSPEGEKAFLEYQRQIAAGRQAIADYQQTRSGRRAVALAPSTAFLSASEAALHAGAEVEVTAPGVSASSVSTDPLPLSDTTPLPDAKPLPVGQPVAETKPAEVRAKLSYQMVYECCGNAPDVNMHEPEQRRRVFFNDESTLVAMLQAAMSEAALHHVPVEIVGLPGVLVYLPEPHCFLFEFNRELLVPLALTRFGYHELSLLRRPDFTPDKCADNAADTTLERADELLWKVALWTSKGRLNKRIDPDKPYRLVAELDFNRLLAIPHASTMQSLWGRHSLSPLAVVKVLKINQRYVFAFLSAAQALGAIK